MTTLLSMRIVLLGIGLSLLSCWCKTADADDRPNIVMVVADDLGFADITERLMPYCTGLANRGTRLNLYAHQNCMPSRAALFTGRYPHRYNLHSVWPTPIEPGLPTDEKILSEHLADAGYVCGMFGKWHLGWQDRAQWPTRRGFKEFVGFLGGHINSYGTQQVGFPYDDGSIGHDHHGIHDLQFNEVPLYTQEYSTELFAKSSVKFLSEYGDGSTPFFLYVPFNAPHGPFSAPRPYVDAAAALDEFDASLVGMLTEYGDDVLGVNPVDKELHHNAARLLYAACVMALDDAVKAIYEKLEETGAAENTLFVFASDNGVSYTFEPDASEFIAFPVGNSSPLQGHKGSSYEAGSRVANFVVWPNKISPNQSVSSNVWIGDLTATYLDIANAAQPDNLDGRSIMSTIETGAPIVRPFGARRIMPMAWKFAATHPDRPEVVSAGQMTIVSAWRKYIRTIYWDENDQLVDATDEKLFDLRHDIGETTNVISDPVYQVWADRSRIEYELFGGEQLLRDLESIPRKKVWQGFVRTLDFGFPDDTNVLETTIP